MALLETTPAVRESETIEWRRTWTGAYLQRTLYEIRCEWACDATGGESVPATRLHVKGGVTCNLETDGPPQIPHGRQYGVYPAVYRYRGGWA